MPICGARCRCALPGAALVVPAESADSKRSQGSPARNRFITGGIQLDLIEEGNSADVVVALFRCSLVVSIGLRAVFGCVAFTVCYSDQGIKEEN